MCNSHQNFTSSVRTSPTITPPLTPPLHPSHPLSLSSLPPDTLSKLHTLSADAPQLQHSLAQGVAAGEVSKERALSAAHWVDAEVG